MKKNVRVVIFGRVQGVWFRASTKQKAEELKLTGWVKNTKEGNVEAVFEGEEEQVNKIINWCYQGPPLSKVEQVKIKNQKPTEIYNEFSIKY